MNNSKKVVGTLLPLTALLGPANLEDGKNAFELGYSFLDWLHKTNQTAWQLLPLHETQLETGSTLKHVPSPYKSYGIGLDSRYLLNSKFEIRNSKRITTFKQEQQEWIYDYALFCALRDWFGTDDWTKWDSGLATYDSEAIVLWTEKLKDKIAVYISEQFQLHEAYRVFHTRAKDLGIRLIGDLPYYPSFRSPVVWAHQDVFQIGENGKLPYVSGIPFTSPTHFGRQVWGHPLYNWDKKQDSVISFWKMRLRYLSCIFDHIRFDHAKAFFNYGVMDLTDQLNDHYKDGPGREVFQTLIEYSKGLGLSIFVEDSGERTEETRKTSQEMHIPGIRIFMFAIKGEQINNRYAEIPKYPENCVAYTTTHDTETLLSFIEGLSKDQRYMLSSISGVHYEEDEKKFARNIRDAIVASPAHMVIIPLQDWLLTNDRINIPGTEKEVGDTNWQYQLMSPIKHLPVL